MKIKPLKYQTDTDIFAVLSIYITMWKWQIYGVFNFDIVYAKTNLYFYIEWMTAVNQNC